MGKIIFDHVIVIGYGWIAENILQYVYEKSEQYHYSMEYIEYEVYPFHTARKYAKANNLPSNIIEDKRELSEYFVYAARKRILIISASNNYLFLQSLVENKNVTIINFHNALLPEFPGRNAPSWAIFEGRKVTGITWHYVSAGIDDGKIIIQKEHKITEDMKAYELAAILMNLAFEAFTECYLDVLEETAEAISQCLPDHRKIYKSKEIPGNAFFELTEQPESIYRLLRAIDYGKNRIFPFPTTNYKNNTIKIKRYKKVRNADRQDAENKLFIPYDDQYLLMLQYETL